MKGERKPRQSTSGNVGLQGSSYPRVHLLRHTYFASDTIVVGCRVRNQKSVRLEGARLQLVNSQGHIAYEADVADVLRGMDGGIANVSIPAEALSPGSYTAVLLVEHAAGVAGATGEICIVRDERKDRLSARNYIHSPLPLTNYLDDIDRMLLASSGDMGRENSTWTTSLCPILTGTLTHVADMAISGACMILWVSSTSFHSSFVYPFSRKTSISGSTLKAIWCG